MILIFTCKISLYLVGIIFIWFVLVETFNFIKRRFKMLPTQELMPTPGAVSNIFYKMRLNRERENSKRRAEVMEARLRELKAYQEGQHLIATNDAERKAREIEITSRALKARSEAREAQGKADEIFLKNEWQKTENKKNSFSLDMMLKETREEANGTDAF
jgi:hypothetical protein